MEFSMPVSSWSGKVRTAAIGTEESGITIGGQNTLPYHHFEGQIPHKPVIAFEVQDVYPSDWLETVTEPYGDCLKNPVDWAKTVVEKYRAEMLCVNLRGTHPMKMLRQ